MFLYAQKIFISFLKMDDKQPTNVFYRGKETTLTNHRYLTPFHR